MSKLYCLAGPEIGRVFELKKETIYIGRSPENDISISDRTLSKRHLKILKRGDKYFVTDLGSRNRTFFNGEYLSPGIEVEAKEGVPIAMGMSVLCIGEQCLEHMKFFADLGRHTHEAIEGDGISADRRINAGQKELELLCKVSDILIAKLPLRETAHKILDSMFGILKRMDRGAFIFIDPKKRSISEVIFKSKSATDDPMTVFSRGVLERVIEDGKPVVVLDSQTEEGETIAGTLDLSRIRSVMCVPLIGGSQILGALYFDSIETPNGFRKEDRSFLLDLSLRIAKVVDCDRIASEFDTVKLTKDLS